MLSQTASTLLLPLLISSQVALAQYTATYTPGNTPYHSEEGQTGTNQCGEGSDQNSMCQNAYINSAEDFCLWAPPSTTSEYGSSAIGNTERIEVAWCTKGGRGTRVIPEGALTGVHFIKTPHYIQITGVGDTTKLNIPAGDDGGELDPHGADGNGNPIGGLVFSDAFGKQGQQIHEWTSFIGDGYFSFRACNPEDPEAADYCQHIYDVMGAGWNAPGNYDAGSFDQCDADAVEKPGVYGSSTFHQGDASTPVAHPAGATSNCYSVTLSPNANVQAILPTMSSSAVADSSSARSSASASAAASSSTASATSSASMSRSSSSASASRSSSSASGSSVSSSSSASASSASASASMSSSVSTRAASSSASVSTTRPAASAASAAASSVSGTSEATANKVPFLAGSAVVGVLAALASFLL